MAAFSNRKINVLSYGAAGDGVTDDTTAIQAALDAANSLGGRIVFIPQGTFVISNTLTLYRKCSLIGSGAEKTILKLANGSNCDMIRSENFATLTNTNAYAPTNANVPYWFGISDLQLDGNKANQTAGNGISFYGNAYHIRGKVVVQDVYNDAIYTEGPAAATLTSWLGQEEGFFDGTVLAIKPGRYGWLFRGPHNSRFGEFRCLLDANGNYGFRSETTANYSAIIDHFDIIHVYGEATNTTNRKGIYIGGITKGNMIQGDSTSIVFENVAVGKAKSLINIVRATGVGKGADNAIGIKVDEAEVFIAQCEVGCNASASGATCIEWGGSLGGIAQLYATDDSGDCNCLRVNGGNTSFDNVNINGFTGTSRIGVDVNATAVNVRGQITNCKTAFYYRSGSRLNADLTVFTATGQAAWGGSTPNGGSDRVRIAETGVAAKNNPSRVITTSGAGNQINMTSTSAQTITLAHACSFTPSTKSVQLSFSTTQTGWEWAYPPTFVSADATNLTIRCQLKVAAASGTGDVIARIEA